jgi:hypothetical protein
MAIRLTQNRLQFAHSETKPFSQVRAFWAIAMTEIIIRFYVKIQTIGGSSRGIRIRIVRIPDGKSLTL